METVDYWAAHYADMCVCVKNTPNCLYRVRGKVLDAQQCVLDLATMRLLPRGWIPCLPSAISVTAHIIFIIPVTLAHAKFTK